MKIQQIAFLSLLISTWFFMPESHAQKKIKIGVIGDSGITGAGADPQLSLNLAPLLSGIGEFLMGPILQGSPLAQALNIKDSSIPYPQISAYGQAFTEFRLPSTLEAPSRVYFSSHEVEPNNKNLAELNLNARGSMKTDLLQYTSPYLTGSALGLNTNQIIYVAQNGQQTSSILKQAVRFFEVPEIKQSQTLPEILLMSFTANDFCSEEVLHQPSDQIIANYKATLQNQLEELTRSFRPSSFGTHIVYMAPFNVIQLFENHNLLNKVIPFLDTSIKCEDLRTQAPILTETSLRKEGFKALVGMCPSLLKTKLSDTEKIEHFRSVFQGVVLAQKEVIANLNSHQLNGWSFSHFNDTYELELEAQDVTNDCFHPSLGAHIKIARKLMLHLDWLMKR